MQASTFYTIIFSLIILCWLFICKFVTLKNIDPIYSSKDTPNIKDVRLKIV